jgi:ribosome maturation factor RimP
MIKKEKVIELINERFAELDKGLFLVSLEISVNNIISIEIDKEEGYVSIDDCMRVSRNVEHNLDREEQDFELQVSSAGLDKPFRVLKQYLKNINREVTVKTLDGQKISGTLKTANDSSISIETSQMVKKEGAKKKELVVETHEFPMNNIKETKIVISFK